MLAWWIADKLIGVAAVSCSCCCCCCTSHSQSKKYLDVWVVSMKSIWILHWWLVALKLKGQNDRNFFLVQLRAFPIFTHGGATSKNQPHPTESTFHHRSEKIDLWELWTRLKVTKWGFLWVVNFDKFENTLRVFSCHFQNLCGRKKLKEAVFFFQ